MEQKEGGVFFLKLLIFPIEREIYINWKQRFVGLLFFFNWLPQGVEEFLKLFSSQTSWDFKDLLKCKGGGKVFL